MSVSFSHLPVLREEVLRLLAVRPGGTYIDGTAGGGGHASAILEQLGPDGFLWALDRDAQAVMHLRERLQPWRENCRVLHANYADMGTLAAAHQWAPADGILLDLGVSSHQLDVPGRGFSFQQDGPLDMRMDQQETASAEEWVNHTPMHEMINVFRKLGEEPQARRVAQAIVAAREKGRISRTAGLAEIVEQAKGGRRGRRHPATRVFQAIRLAVNRELEHLETGLAAALLLLAPRGRLAVITFHSLEDRMVKQRFAAHAGRMVSLPQGGEEWQGIQPRVRRITRKPVTAGKQELALNPRARSAKLRVIEKE